VRKLFDIIRDDVWAATGTRSSPSPRLAAGREDFYFVGGK